MGVPHAWQAGFGQEINKDTLGLRDGSVVKRTGCACRGPRFSPQHPHVGSQPSITPVPGDLVTFSGLEGHHTQRSTYTYNADKALNSHKNKINKSKIQNVSKD